MLLATKNPKATGDTVLGIVSPGEAMTNPGTKVGFGVLYAAPTLILAEAGGWVGGSSPVVSTGPAQPQSEAAQAKLRS